MNHFFLTYSREFDRQCLTMFSCSVNFDLDKLKELESKAEELEMDVKKLEAKKAELEAVETEKKLQEIRDREARIEEKKWKKQQRKEELARKRERLRNAEPERSFFARDQDGRNGIHKFGGFTFYAMVGTVIYSITSIIAMNMIWSDPKDIEEVQVYRKGLIFVVVLVAGILGWKNCTKMKHSTQFNFGILGLSIFFFYVIGYLIGNDPDKQIDDALTPDSWEGPADK